VAKGQRQNGPGIVWKYGNEIPSYRAAIDILARGRVAGLVPWEAIDDATRPIHLNNAFQNPSEFFQQQFKNFLNGYWRNRLQSQPYHIEIVAEKLTVQTILQKVALEFTMPLTISRGMGTLSPKKAIRDRFLLSQKQGLKLLVVTDLDPARDTIADDLVKSFKRDFGLQNIEAFKVALAIEQRREFALEPSTEAKDSSPTYPNFVAKYPELINPETGIADAFELEPLSPTDLAQPLEDAIADVLDVELYNQELEAEETDSTKIIAVQQQTLEFFKSLKL
jgi:hypothetical protein